jgi:hypothetical protein
VPDQRARCGKVVAAPTQSRIYPGGVVPQSRSGEITGGSASIQASCHPGICGEWVAISAPADGWLRPSVAHRLNFRHPRYPAKKGGQQ